MNDNDINWFVMRDLTRYHSKLPAYQMLDNLKIENYTPKVQKIFINGSAGKSLLSTICFLCMIADCT